MVQTQTKERQTWNNICVSILANILWLQTINLVPVYICFMAQ